MNELIIEVNSKNKTGFGFRAYTETYDQMEIMDKIKTALRSDKKERNKIIDECINIVNKQLNGSIIEGTPKDLEEFLDGARSNMKLIIQDLQALKGGQVDLFVIPQKLLKEIAKIMEIEVDFNGKNGTYDMDKYGLLAYLKDDFMGDRQFNTEKIVKIVRLMDKNNMPIENLKFLSA